MLLASRGAKSSGVIRGNRAACPICHSPIATAFHHFHFAFFNACAQTCTDDVRLDAPFILNFEFCTLN